MALPDLSQRAWEPAAKPAMHGALPQLASASLTEPGLSGFRLIGSGTEALQARFALIEQATGSIDLQVYQFKGDATGRALMLALREAARRGVRVRLLVDDLYTAGDDGLWLALSSQPGIELRLFNPFFAARQSHWSRLVESAFGHERMHRRMHNKLLVADGVLALAGGRNIADAYYMSTAEGVFVDIDVLAAGPVVKQMTQAFDLYWNSEYSVPFGTVLEMALSEPPRLADGMADLNLPCDSPECAAVRRVRAADSLLAREFAEGRVLMRMAEVEVAWDMPTKIEHAGSAVDMGMLAAQGARVRLLIGRAIRQAQSELVIVSPYLIPGPVGVAGLGGLRQRGVQVTMLTNSLAATDEPMVHVGYRKYRAALLREGVTLYEWSPVRGDRLIGVILGGGSVLRLHAKAALVDRELVFLGSMNFDPRSRDLNTEFGLLIRSRELGEEIQALLQRLLREGAYRLHLHDDGRTLHWTAGDSDEHIESFEPDTHLGTRLLLDLLEPLVPEELL